MGWTWKLLQENCTGCGICSDVCPHDAILLTRQMAYPEPVLNRCVGDLGCVRQCPFDAIAVRAPVSQLTGKESALRFQP